MWCLGRFVWQNDSKSARRLEQTVLMPGLLRIGFAWSLCVSVLDPCSVTQLSFILCACVCVLLKCVPNTRHWSTWQYLPNHCLFYVFPRWTLQWMLWSLVALSPWWRVWAAEGRAGCLFCKSHLNVESKHSSQVPCRDGQVSGHWSKSRYKSEVIKSLTRVTWLGHHC